MVGRRKPQLSCCERRLIACSAGNQTSEEAKEFLKYMMTKEAAKSGLNTPVRSALFPALKSTIRSDDAADAETSRREGLLLRADSAFTGQYYSDLDKIFIQGQSMARPLTKSSPSGRKLPDHHPCNRRLNPRKRFSWYPAPSYGGRGIFLEG